MYEVAAAVDRAAPLIAASYPLAGLPHLSMSNSTARTLSLHPGAQRYADRNLPSVLERYAEIFALIATMVVAAGSAGVALHRRRRQSRKDRLDGYYSRALDHRPSVGASVEDRIQCRAAIRSIQAEVFDLVIAERIDADAALIAFLTLSNQLLAESESDI